MPRVKASHRYTRTAIVLHWLLAAMVLASVAVGWWMTGLPLSPRRLVTYNLHKWTGVLILALTLVRLAWRWRHPPPPPLGAVAWQRRAAAASHAALYALCVAVPLVGWAYSSAAGFPVVLFGVWPLPDFVSADRALADAIKPWHGWLAWTLLALAGVHAAAAIKHHLVDRDGLLNRMLPARSR
jgi:cytochrome b561